MSPSEHQVLAQIYDLGVLEEEFGLGFEVEGGFGDARTVHLEIRLGPGLGRVSIPSGTIEHH